MLSAQRLVGITASGGVHPKVAQALARHGSISLTMDRYTHTVVGDLRDALHALPDLSPEVQQALKTGSDGLPVNAPTDARQPAHHFPHQLDRETSPD
ncbi:MAG: hypothetical protein NTW96_27735, partial [Planctomycetia bacterium]|nr:hypothetical protein [Planctomycetia bacterium]